MEGINQQWHRLNSMKYTLTCAEFSMRLDDRSHSMSISPAIENARFKNAFVISMRVGNDKLVTPQCRQ